MDEYERPFWSVGAALTYAPSVFRTFSASVSVSSPYASEDTDPKLNQGIDDVGFDWTEKEVWSNERLGNLSSLVSLELPTSELSKRQGKFFATVSKLNLATPLRAALSRVTLLGVLGMNISAFQYDLSSPLGPDYNSPFGLSQGAGLSLRVIDGLSFANLYSVSQRYEYGGYWIPAQKFTSGLNYQYDSHTVFALTYKWADRIFSDDPAFTARKTSLTGELSYDF